MTSTCSIRDELSQVHNLGQIDIEWFRAQGVPALALGRAYHGGGYALGRDQVVFHRGWFEFERYHKGRGSPVPVYIFAAENVVGDLADLVAWCPNSGRLATLLGRVALLGEEQAFGPRLGNLMLHADPLEWLRAGRKGVVVIDKRGARSILRDTGPIEVPTVKLGVALHDMLSDVDMPSILVTQPAEVTT